MSRGSRNDHDGSNASLWPWWRTFLWLLAAWLLAVEAGIVPGVYTLWPSLATRPGFWRDSRLPVFLVVLVALLLVCVAISLHDAKERTRRDEQQRQREADQR